MSELRNRSIPLNPSRYWERRNELAEQTRQAMKFLRFMPHGLNFPDGLQGVHPFELTRLGFRVLDASNIWQAYEILAEKSERGRPYYDETLGLQHQRVYAVMENVLAKYEPHFQTGLDIGSGTGELSLRLGRHCDRVIALDLVQPLLKTAGEKLTNQGINHRLVIGDFMEVDTLLPPDSIDVAVMNGFEPYLSPREVLVFIHRLRDVLKPGGRFYAYVANNYFLTRYTLQRMFLPRVKLAQTIGGVALDLTLIDQHSDSPQEIMAVEGNGFESEIIRVKNPSPIEEQVLRLQKV